jgi:hypothetical protein
MDKGYSDLTFQKEFIIEEKMTPKQKIETYAVFFGAGKSELTTEATNTIDEVARILKANSGYTLFGKPMITSTTFSVIFESMIKPEAFEEYVSPFRFK